MNNNDASYTFRGRPFAAETTLEMKGDRLVAWQASREIIVPYGEIEAVRLYYRPRGMDMQGFRGKLYILGGRTITFEDRTWKSLVESHAQRGPYRRFTQALCVRVAKANPGALFHAGRSYAVLIPTAILGLATTAALATLGGRAVFNGNTLTGLTILAFAGLFGWWSWHFVVRNRPIFFNGDSVPETVLPTEK